MHMIGAVRKFREFYRNNGFLLGSRLLLAYAAMRLRSWFIGLALDAKGIRIGPGSEIRGAGHIQIGEGFASGRGLWLEAVYKYRGHRHQPRIKIGRNVSCSQDVHISCIQELIIGDGVLIGSSVYIGDHNHGRYSGQAHSSPDEPPAVRALWGRGSLVIEDKVFIADKVTIVGGVRIGHGTVVAANSVVTKSLPAMCIAAGAPAKVVRQYDAGQRCWGPPKTEIMPDE